MLLPKINNSPAITMSLSPSARLLRTAKTHPAFGFPRRPVTTSLRRSSSEPPEKATKVSSNYNRPPVPRSRTTDQLPVLPLVAIFALGSASFYYIVKSREGSGRPGGHQPNPDRAPEDRTSWPRNTTSDQTLSRR